MPEEKNLEQLRDEKCVPVARGIINDMAISLVPDDANKKVDYNPIVKSMLERTLEADLNIATENTYIFQLILTAFAGLNKTVQECETVPIDDVRYGTIAKKILSILATANISLLTKTPEQEAIEFAPVKEQLNALFAQEKLSMLEVKYVMDNIFDSLSAVQNSFMLGVTSSAERAEAKLFGIEAMSDLTMKKLDDVLKKPTE